MEYAIAGTPTTRWQSDVVDALTQTMSARGHLPGDLAGTPQVVFHLVDSHEPRPFRRRSRATFVVGVADRKPGEWLATAYPVLIRSISNVLIWGDADGAAETSVEIITPELGHYPIGVDHEAQSLGTAIYERLEPLMTSRLVIENLFDEDLPLALHAGTPVTDSMVWASRVLDRWNLFPAPFPIQDVLAPDEYRHLRHVFSIGGLSYGNLSARHEGTSFWMSASGVDKGKIQDVSRDILLVKGYDPALNAMRLSVAPGSRPHRVSVDAIEHWEVYRRHPEVAAMIHIHAWVDGVASTAVNYPCGTIEMGVAMADLLDREPHPERTVIGLRNHGITATGPTFYDIISRLDGHVRPTVPMT